MAPMAGDSRSGFLLLVLALSLLPFQLVRGLPPRRRYEIGEPVQIWASKVGPVFSPSVTYPFYDVPFCQPDPLVRKKESIGDILRGDHLTNSLYALNFGVDKGHTKLCEKNMSVSELVKFRNAISGQYYYQMYLDDIPFWVFIGMYHNHTEDTNGKALRYFLANKLELDIRHYQNKVLDIHARFDGESLINISEDTEAEISFFYQVKWETSPHPFEKELIKKANPVYVSGHGEISWFFIGHSAIAVIFSVVFLGALLVHILHVDIHKYGNEPEESDYGWKNVHGDVFRYPQNKTLFCAVLGAGTHLLIASVFVFLLACVSILYPSYQGTIYAAQMIAFALTSVIAGYASSTFFFQLEGENLKEILLLTGIIFNGPLVLILAALNTLAIFYKSTIAVPFGTMVVIILIWASITIPMLFLGGFLGLFYKRKFPATSGTRETARVIPPQPWYGWTLPQFVAAGIATFLAVMIELPYIFINFWSLKFYAVIYGIEAIFFTLLLVAAVFASIGLTYFQLLREDHRWWWRTLLYGSGAAIMVFTYAYYLYSSVTHMSGFLQTCFYFGYTFCFCYALFLMLGTVSFYGSLYFVLYMYGTIKVE